MAAARHENHHDMVALLEVVDARADFSIIPAASCPSAIGIGRGRSPLITERSEWHKTGGFDLHQHLAVARVLELELVDLQRSRFA